MVVDPVMAATSGGRLLELDAIAAYRRVLFPRATVLTPNLDEAALLLGWRPRTLDEMRRAVGELRELGGGSILLKGGHLPGTSVVDILLSAEGKQVELTGERIEGVDTHGSGCTLAAAIAAGLALGEDVQAACRRAQAYLRQSLETPLYLGERAYLSHGPVAG
jgi:hydroxymethylpyrimidine/phosphomethylpyrimidine kinase